MKIKNLLLNFALISIIVLKTDAQTSIPNGNFETWSSLSFDTPQNYVWSSNEDALKNSLPFNVIKSTDAYHGNFAVQMTTEILNGDTLPGIFVSVNPQNSNPAFWHGGFPYSQKPTGMSGYYKSSIATPDTGFVLAFFYKSGVMIGQYGFYLYGTHNTYTPFSFSFNPVLPQNPDTVIFGAGSSNYANTSNMRNGSMLLLDSVSFTGVISQPTLFNGDFETWQTTTIDLPNSWFINGSGGNNLTGGAYKTTDAKAGSNAIELITYVGDRNNNPIAQSGQISTGWYPNNCGGNCQEQGGFPFSNQVDTLAFWYKYAPSGNDNAEVNINFKSNGNNIGYSGISLSSSANYQYIEIPFNVGQTPDSVIVDIHSSSWQDSLLSFVGSDLKIDEIHFKSQPLSTGILNYGNQNAVSIYPNPTGGNLSINLTENIGKQFDLNVFNTLGQQIFAKRIYDNTGTTTIDLSQFSEGIYFLHMISDNRTFYDKKIIIAR